MFEAELLGLTESQYGHIAGLLLGPALGFAFLFLLSLPLKKLPFLAVDADFKPPEWVVPVFAITLVFLFFFFLVTTASLSSFKSHPDKEGFLTTFIKERKLNIERREGRLYRAEVTIAHYDQYSNLEIVVNGHRVFGSFSDCLMSYQCRPQGDQSAIDKLNTLVSLKLTDGSIYNLFSLNSLPKTIDLLHYLTVGTNYVDIYSFNSGLNDCDVEVDTAIYSTNKSHKYNIKITPSDREDDVASYSTDTIEETNETLNSGFRLEEGNTSGLMFPYNTFDYSSFKLCQRVRLVLGLDASQVPYSLDEWRGWALARRNVEVCELFNYDQSGCEKSTGNKRRIITVSERPLMIVGAAALCGSILAVVAVACLGENFKPGAIGHLDQVGRIEVIRLPATARDLDGIRTFSVKMGGADDYGRVFVNNYLVLNTENPDKLFYTDNDPKEKKEAASKLALRRNQFMVGEAGVVHLLHRGKNYIVAEVENSLWGACSGGIEVIVNGSLLENFPRGFPDRLSVEEDVMNTGLGKLYDQSHVPAVFDALCSRRIFEFQLQ